MSLSEKLISAAKTGDTKEVRKLLSRGALFAKDKFGNTALHEAAWNGNSDIVKLLLKSFCFVDSINSTGFTPLHLASQNGHAKVVKTLLKWQADPALLNEHGESALHLAAKYDHPNVITTLAGTKMDVNMRGKDENTALHIAAKLGNIESAKALISKGANPYLRNEKGVLPVEYAGSGGFSDVVKLLQAATQKFKNSDCFLQSSQASGHDAPKPFMRSSSVSSPMVMRVNKEDTTKKHSYPLDIRLHAERYSMSPCQPDDIATPTQTKRSTSPNIEQLLTEIEQECHGPGYKFQPPQPPRSGSMSPPQDLSSNNTPRLPAKVFLKSTREGCTPPATSNYDILEPRVDNPTSPPHKALDSNPTSPPHKALDSNPTSPPHKALDSKDEGHDKGGDCFGGCHQYESLSPRSPADKDGYVYMASLSEMSNLECNARSNANAKTGAGDLITSTMLRSRGSKVRPRRAIICTSPVQLCTKHEPSSKTPTKGILAQHTPDGDAKSQVDRYLQEELETMRQAFQIRLAQLEKRYQRRLVQEQKRNSQHHTLQSQCHTPQPQCHTPQPNTLQRRRSWHGPNGDEEGVPPKLQMSTTTSAGAGKEVKQCLSGDSESDIDSPLPTLNGNNEPNPPKVKGGLKGGSNQWRERCGEESYVPNLSPTRTLEQCNELSEATRQMINQRLHEYHVRMTQHFNEKAEAKVAAIELEYQHQLCEIQRQCQGRSSQRTMRMGTRVKDLEVTPRAHTLV